MGVWFVAGPRDADVALMLEVRVGCERSFAELYRRYHRRVQDFFYGLTRDRQTSADLCQETFLRIWRVRGRYAATGSFPSYLFTFARNIWLEHRRTVRKTQRLGTLDSSDTSWNLLCSPETHAPDSTAGRNELRAHLFAALDALPEEQRMVFVLRNIDGLALEEIASVMQCPVNTVRSRKLLAQKKIREWLRERMVTPRHAL